MDAGIFPEPFLEHRSGVEVPGQLKICAERGGPVQEVKVSAPGRFVWPVGPFDPGLR